MENTVNERVLMLKTHFNLGRNDFASKAGISPTTYDSIVNGNNVYPKTIKSIITAFNVNTDWLLHGKGKMFNAEPKEAPSNDPWKDALVMQVKEENTRLQRELERVWQMVQHLTGGAKPNFLKAFNGSGLPYLLPGKSFEAKAAA